MSDDGWGPWKLAAMGAGLVMVTALVTGLVVANWTGPLPMARLPAPAPTTPQIPVPASGRVAPGGVAPVAKPGDPPQAIVDACNQYATKIGQRVVTAENRSLEERYRDAYASCLRARGYPR
jgi:hypothetical protein